MILVYGLTVYWLALLLSWVSSGVGGVRGIGIRMFDTIKKIFTHKRETIIENITSESAYIDYADDFNIQADSDVKPDVNEIYVDAYLEYMEDF